MCCFFLCVITFSTSTNDQQLTTCNFVVQKVDLLGTFFSILNIFSKCYEQLPKIIDFETCDCGHESQTTKRITTKYPIRAFIGTIENIHLEKKEDKEPGFGTET